MLVFNTLRFKNILSVGNYFIEIPLDKYDNIVISGINGSGKSTILDALCFALYNKPFRNVNKGEIVNSTNGKLVTEVEFTKGSDRYKIVRGQKPTVFEIYKNDVAIQEDSHSRDYQKFLENTILQMNHKAFTQVVVLGSAVHTPFMQLKTPERRALIESLLDLEIFSSMNVIAKQKLSDIKEEIKDIDSKISRKEVEIESKERYIQRIEQDSESQIETHRESEKEYQGKIKAENEKLKIALEKLDSIDTKKLSSALITLKNTRNILLKSKGGVDFGLEEINKRLRFFDLNDICPTCHQTINKEFIEKIKQEISVEQESLANQLSILNNQNKAIDDKIKKLDQAALKVQTFQKTVDSINTEIGKYTDKVEFLHKEIKRIESIKDLRKDKDELKTLNQELKTLFKEKDYLQKQKGLFEISLILLKDSGVKAEIIKSYIPLINQIINEHLSTLDMFVKFELDENFEESLKGRHIDNRKYFSFSEGEKARIDISILFMFREIARRRNTVHTNLLLMDEILDSALDVQGSESMVKMLKGRDSNNIIISHDETVLEQFTGRNDHIINVKKKGNFSYYE